MRVFADQPADSDGPIPVRMLNEYSFCPRLFYLEHVERDFEENGFTVEGRLAHRRVDVRGGAVVAPGEDEAFEARSVELSSELLGISARIDLVEGDGGEVVPVDYKRGSPPRNEMRSHEPERIQLCAYGLLLRERGHRCERGVLYFAEAKVRVEVVFDDALVERTREVIRLARATIAAGVTPPPLRGSPKCEGCSLHAICLPDEVNALRVEDSNGAAVRFFAPAKSDANPLYVTEQGARVGLKGEVIEVTGREREKLLERRLLDVSQLVLVGNVQVSAQALRELAERELPVCWMSFGGWFAGQLEGLGHGNVELRRRQFRAADDSAFCLRLARRLVRTKLLNARTLLRRNHDDAPRAALEMLAEMSDAALGAESIESLLGIEGSGARAYFGAFAGMIRSAEGPAEFDFAGRNRRPPKDPVNALLSFAYSLLAKEFAVAIKLTGMDPLLGFYHRPRFGRPALALDLMEEFRPLVADSAVLTALNTGVIKSPDFRRSSLGVALKDGPRRDFVRVLERRLAEEVTHPVFGYRASYRRVLQIQTRLFARHLLGELDEYPEFRTR